jgi:hypothetical protein
LETELVVAESLATSARVRTRPSAVSPPVEIAGREPLVAVRPSPIEASVGAPRSVDPFDANSASADSADAGDADSAGTVEVAPRSATAALF